MIYLIYAERNERKRAWAFHSYELAQELVGELFMQGWYVYGLATMKEADWLLLD